MTQTVAHLCSIITGAEKRERKEEEEEEKDESQRKDVHKTEQVRNGGSLVCD